jgi:hypothetical protein
VSRRRFSKRTNHPPQGEPWIWHTLELISSPAWRGRSINCIRLIEYLEIEHLRHGGNENGQLLAPYMQLVAFGIGKRLISDAIAEGEARGLVSVKRGGRKGTTMNECSTYRLTYLWTKTRRDGLWDWKEPTNEWRRFKEPRPQNRFTFVH